MFYGAVRIQKTQLKPAQDQKGGDVARPHHAGKTSLAAVKRIVAGQPGGRPVRAMNRIDHRFAQSIQKIRSKFGQGRFQPPHKGTKVHHIGVTFRTRVHIVFRGLGLPAVGGVKAVVIHGEGNSFKAERVVSKINKRNPGKINERKRGVSRCLRFLAALKIGIADSLAQRFRAYGCVCPKSVHPFRVLPAVGWLHLLRCHHVPAKTAYSAGCVQRSHQAGVKADDFKWRAVN